MNLDSLLWIGIILVFIGILIIGLSSLLMMTQKSNDNVKVKNGAIIFLGPIPLAFGTDKDSLILVSVLMLVLMLLSFLLAGKIRF